MRRRRFCRHGHVEPQPVPERPVEPYCPVCGLRNKHWTGCPNGEG